MPELLRQAFEQEILARGAGATERLTALVAALGAEETPPHPQFNGLTLALGTDDSSDWMSAEAVAKLLDVSPANVKKLAEDGALGAVDANGSGLHRHERAAVLAYYNETKRRKRK